jgi:hypothetical protein
MNMTMQNLSLQTSSQNRANDFGRNQHALCHIQQELVPTLQHKVTAKSEVSLTHAQLREAAWLFKQYDLQKPGWLRTRFVVNQRRRKQLNEVLREAGLDSNWCGTRCDADNWSALLHSLWHSVNGRHICI